jgi:hypothetical protein
LKQIVEVSVLPTRFESHTGSSGSLDKRTHLPCRQGRGWCIEQILESLPGFIILHEGSERHRPGVRLHPQGPPGEQRNGKSDQQ